MPRYRRLHAPGALVHIIGRFVHGRFRLCSDELRAMALSRLGASLRRTDWTLCAYALMSSHIHLALLAGELPPASFIHPFHTSVATTLNRVHGTFGPVFAERATTVVMPTERLAVLAAYVHNHPVRAGLVSHAAESTWTSHRAWMGIHQPPPWLAVHTALHLTGFDATDAGRRRFDAFVTRHRSSGREPWLSGSFLPATRRRAREATRLPVEISSPELFPTWEDVDAGAHVLVGAEHAIAPRWNGDLETLIDLVAEVLCVPKRLVRSASRSQTAAKARRLVLAVGVWFLRRSVREVSRALDVSEGTGSRSLQQAAPLLELAREVADALRRETRDTAICR